MARLTNQEIVESMVQLEDKIEQSFTSVARAMEMIGEMVEFLSKRLDEVQSDLDVVHAELDLLKKKEKKRRMILSNELEVDLVQHVGSDAIIASAARVSTGNDLDKFDTDTDAKLINYLMKHRHGSPFEHNSMTFRISAPIFVFREFQRHRVGWSYNEVSARYKEMEPKFWTYPPTRPLIQEGSSAHPDLVHGHPAMTTLTNVVMEKSYRKAYKAYKELLEDGVANEVARSVLPVGLFSEMYATCNARSLMAFLSLRVDAENARFETKPQWEIENVAMKMEEEFLMKFPSTWSAFNNNGRVSP